MQARYERFAASQTEMFELVSAGVAVFGAERRLISANRAFLRIFQMDEEFVEVRSRSSTVSSNSCGRRAGCRNSATFRVGRPSAGTGS